MPKFNFRMTAMIEAESLQSARDAIKNLPGLEDIDIEDGPEEAQPIEDEDDVEN